jgi:biotin-(acetyl-CoA carboxylase) ligase
VNDLEFVDKLIAWSNVIRKTFADDAIDEVISTRRLCHIVKSHSIFANRMKSIEMCINRFDTETKQAFLDLYTKVDESATPLVDVEENTNNTGDTAEYILRENSFNN